MLLAALAGGLAVREAPAVSPGADDPIALLPMEPDPVVPAEPVVSGTPVVLLEPVELVDGVVNGASVLLVFSLGLLQPPSAKAVPRTSATPDLSVGGYKA